MILVLALILFVLLVVVHEYGHFLAAKRNGVDVEEFGIGFPPKIAGKTMGKGIFRGYYTINALPLGGFVRLKGESDADKGKGTFGAATFWVKIKVILAGVFMNLITSIFIFTVLAFTGMPQLIDNQFTVASDETVSRSDVVVATLAQETPAGRAGIKAGDTLISIDGGEITDSESLFSLTESFQDQLVPVSYVRGGETFTTDVQFNPAEDQPTDEDGNPQGFFGVVPVDVESKRYTWSAPVVGVGSTLQFAGLTYQGLGSLVADVFQTDFESASEQVSGPVGIISLINNVSVLGLSFVVFLMGVISLTLAIMNSLPIPALDGGRLFVSGIYKLLKKPLTQDVEQRIHGTGFVVLMGLILLITVLDVQRIF